MKRYILKIQLLLMVLALGTLASCSSEEELTGNTTTTLAAGQIEVGSFPAFSENTGSRASNIGTPDAGKTAWASGDVILLKTEVCPSFENNACTGTAESTSTYTLTYNGSAWTLDKDIALSATSYLKGVRFTAYYAPNYEWTSNELILKTGKTAGTDEYLTTTSEYAYSALSSTTPKISFSSASRNYSRLRVATEINGTIILTAADFTPVGANEALGENKLTTIADDKGNAYFYGSWITSNTAKISSPKAYGTCEKDFTLPQADAAKSYAVAGPKWKIYNIYYYFWDAKLSCVENGPYNKEYVASNSCKDCPTARQLVKYINAGYYYDDGTIETEGWQTYTVLHGDAQTPTDYHNGLWLPKSSTIDGFDDETTGEKEIPKTPIADEHKITAANAADIRTSGKYFFLPAAGYGLSVGIVDVAGFRGNYWSKTSETDPLWNEQIAYYLYFDKDYVAVDGGFLGDMTNAPLPMVIE